MESPYWLPVQQRCAGAKRLVLWAPDASHETVTVLNWQTGNMDHVSTQLFIQEWTANRDVVMMAVQMEGLTWFVEPAALPTSPPAQNLPVSPPFNSVVTVTEDSGPWGPMMAAVTPEPSRVDCAQAGVRVWEIPVRSDADEAQIVSNACKDFFTPPSNHCKFGKYCQFAHDSKEFGKVRPRWPTKADTDKYRIYLCKSGNPRE